MKLYCNPLFCLSPPFLTEPLMESLMHRIPSLANAEIRQMINGPESFTPDLHAIMGEAPEVLICVYLHREMSLPSG